MAAVLDTALQFNVETFLALEQRKDLLRFSTAGSVDDGKSTLIGRLLYDSQNVYEDQIKSVTKASVNRSAGPIDFSLLTDGLRAEREQGITIDVAYRYFSTARRKFIIADTPGHEQYTRNMATGASTADLAIILIDARKGVLPQSRRHAYIAWLLGIPKFVIAVNKMDLVGYDENVFNRIRDDFGEWMKNRSADLFYLPISALEGDNVVTRSQRMPWFEGPSLLEHLETVTVDRGSRSEAFRFPVQRVIRPDQNFRGYAGQIASGTVRPGDTVYALPSGRTTRVKTITTFDGNLDLAQAPMSVTLTLDDELDLSRGDMLAPAGLLPHVARRFEARVVWMNDRPLERSRRYLLKHTSQLVSAEITALRFRIDVNTLAEERAETLEMNAIGLVEIETGQPLFFDAYERNRITGSFILIDRETNATVGAGMIVQAAVATHRVRSIGHVTPEERRARFGHGPAIVSVGRREKLALLLERRLFEDGCAVTLLRDPSSDVLSAVQAAGLVAIVLDRTEAALPHDDQRAADEICNRLFEAHEHGIEGEGI
jgi:sulfate adenylyltransferase large subunit